MYRMKFGMMVGFALLLSGCVGSVQNMKVADVAANTGYLILDLDATFDGYHAEGEAFSTTCFLGVSSMDSATFKDMDVAAKGDTFHFRMMSTTKPGRYEFNELTCRAYKVMWNKTRKKTLSPPLVVDIKPGEITYPGTLVIDWESGGMNGLDLLFGGIGAADEDEGKLVMKRADRSASIKAKLEEQNPALMQKFKFVTTDFESNPQIVQ